MTPTKAMRGVLRILLLFLALSGTAGLVVYWITFRTPQADWRILAVGLLLAAVLGWWPWISLGVAASLCLLTVFMGPEPQLRWQIAGEILVFWILGLGWGSLAKIQLHPQANLSAPRRAPVSGGATPSMRSADLPVQRSTSLTGVSEGDIPRPPREKTHSSSNLPHPAAEAIGWTTSPMPQPLEPRTSASTGLAAPRPPPLVPNPLPRPVAPPSLAEYGNESIYLGSLPDPSKGVSAMSETTHALPAVRPSSVDAPGSPPPVSSPFQTHPAYSEEISVVAAVDFPTMELPVNTLLRPARGPSSTPSGASSHSGPGSALGEALEQENPSSKRSSSFQRPETVPGASWEHLLEWYNQFSWSPWKAEELEQRYHRSGFHVGWEVLALKDLAGAWKSWRQGCIPLEMEAGRIDLQALEGFLRCEILGVLRQQGFPDLHVLTKLDGPDAWLGVYHEVRGRMRGGEAVVRRTGSAALAVDEGLGLVGRPDRLAEIRGENDVVALVTPFSRSERLSWSGVYAVAQFRLAQAMGVVLSATPVVVNLPLPVWDERKQSRIMVVEDMGSEQRRLEVALERFRRVLSGQAPPRPQTEASTCSGCGWRHFCSSYQGSRPRLDLSNPPAQIAAGLK